MSGRLRYHGGHAWDCLEPGFWKTRDTKASVRMLFGLWFPQGEVGPVKLGFKRIEAAMTAALEKADRGSVSSAEPRPVEANPEEDNCEALNTLSERSDHGHEHEKEPHPDPHAAVLGRHMGGDAGGERPLLQAEPPPSRVEAVDRPLPRGASQSRRGCGIYAGRWQDHIAKPGWSDIEFDHVITDPPFSERVHSKQEHGRNDGTEDGLASDGFGYAAMTKEQAYELVGVLDGRCRGWFCVITSHDMIPTWEELFREFGRYVFAPVPCIQRGSSVRLQGDGPSSVTSYLIASRPRTRDAARWRTLPGYYIGPRPERLGVRGAKSMSLMLEIVRDYSDPGQLIFDPFAGSGTTLLAARELSRMVVGCEVRDDAYKIARKRLETPWQAALL